MTAAAGQPAERPGVLSSLMALVRPEWRGEVFTFPLSDPVFGGARCAVAGCDRVGRAITLCYTHYYRWSRLGRPAMSGYTASTGVIDPRRAGQIASREGVDLRALPQRLRLEVQYALQCRSDEAQAKTLPTTVAQAVNFLARSAVPSLLAESEEQWWARFGRGQKQRQPADDFILYARRLLETLELGSGWDLEYPRDVWRLRELGDNTGTSTHAYFDQIPQPWLKDLAKRYARWRLSTGMGTDVTTAGCRAATRFGLFLARRPEVAGPGDLTRDVLEAYLADLQAELRGRPVQRDHVGQLNCLFLAVRQHGWAQLPSSAMYFTEDYPKAPVLLPRAVAEHVMAQIEHPDNLARWNEPAYRLATLILIRCGLRIGDAMRLPIDCVIRDAEGAPYLRYYNHKMKREALVPIDEDLERGIAAQRARLAERWPAPVPVLFPRPLKNAAGTHPIRPESYRDALYRWLESCAVRDEYGAPTTLTPHQWRHTLGTRLINRDVPQEVVRLILDHDSHAMTAHYARIHDTTVRRHWEAARKIDIAGRPVALDPEGPLAEAAWAKARLGRATQALPNGFCGLPVQKSCPHANACLTCPMFITTPEFLPLHQIQRAQTVEIITAAEGGGQTRLADMNKTVLANLDTIIAALETPEETTDAA